MFDYLSAKNLLTILISKLIVIWFIWFILLQFDDDFLFISNDVYFILLPIIFVSEFIVNVFILCDDGIFDDDAVGVWFPVWVDVYDILLGLLTIDDDICVNDVGVCTVVNIYFNNKEFYLFLSFYDF
jgi:hypothetical protein